MRLPPSGHTFAAYLNKHNNNQNNNTQLSFQWNMLFSSGKRTMFSAILAALLA